MFVSYWSFFMFIWLLILVLKDRQHSVHTKMTCDHAMMLMSEYDDAYGDAMLMVNIQANTRSVTASMLRWETMYPKSMPRGMPKTHFSGLSLILFARRQPKAISRSWIRSPYLFDLTTMSSTYASTVDPLCSPKTWSMHRWYVALVFRSPKGMVT